MTSKNFSSNQNSSNPNQKTINIKAAKPKGIIDAGFILATLKRQIWLPTLAFVGFFFVLPLASAMYLGNTTLKTAEQILSNYNDLMALVTIWTAIIAMIGAALAGISIFGYLQNRKQIDFYHSMPISREKFFVTNLIVGFLAFLLPYIICHIMNVVVLLGYNMDAVFNLADYLTAMAEVTLAFLAVFGATVLGVMLTGNRFGSLKFAGFVLFVPTLVVGIWYALHAAYYDTYMIEYTNFETLLIYSSPAIRYPMSFDSAWYLGLTDYIYFAVYAVLTLAVAFALYKIRPSEAAGRTLAFPKIKPFVKYPLVLLVAIGGGIFFGELGYQSQMWMYIGAVLTTFLLAQTLEILFESDFKAIKNALIPALLTAVLACGTLFVFANDVFGYDEFVPTASEVKSINVNLSNVVDIENSINRLDYPYGSTYNYNEAMLEKVELTDEASIEAVLAMAQNYVDRTAGETNNSYAAVVEDNTYMYTVGPTAEFSTGGVITIYDTTNSYDTVDYVEYVDSGYFGNYNFGIEVIYNLENGKEAVRSYWTLTYKDNIDEIVSILNSDDFKNHFAIYDMDSSLCVISEFTSILNSNFNVNLSYAEQSELMEIYRTELKAMSGEDLINGVRIGDMRIRTFNNEEELLNYKKYNDTDEYTYMSDNSFSTTYPVYALMDETVAYIEAHGGSFDLQGQLISVEKRVDTEYETYYESVELTESEMYELFNQTVGQNSLMLGIGNYETRYNFYYNNGDYTDSVARYLLSE